ncbi:MAG TPA: LLM class flavin-dependent oxidoreductase [Thermofilum sp.]|nr:LLM class flavin-dependent oxidoreductase [Thermofilum sp.]
MWTEPEVNFTGKYYKIEEGLNFPKLIQKLHPPILIGGGDEKFTLRVVAMHYLFSSFVNDSFTHGSVVLWPSLCTLTGLPQTCSP